ncbi:MAG: hypothetical protein F4Y39_23900 [Gemmatimonadetes bacterium]|nr:hypothetical protein [Gemmatimonadota bacterium]
MDLLIPYGDLKGELVSPGDIRLRRGKNCGAVCPDINCKKPLTLRDGGRTVTHFAHPPSETGEYSCNGETALHQRMKEILQVKNHGFFLFLYVTKK